MPNSSQIDHLGPNDYDDIHTPHGMIGEETRRNTNFNENVTADEYMIPLPATARSRLDLPSDFGHIMQRFILDNSNERIMNILNTISDTYRLELNTTQSQSFHNPDSAQDIPVQPNRFNDAPPANYTFIEHNAEATSAINAIATHIINTADQHDLSDIRLDREGGLTQWTQNSYGSNPESSVYTSGASLATSYRSIERMDNYSNPPSSVFAKSTSGSRSSAARSREPLGRISENLYDRNNRHPRLSGTVSSNSPSEISSDRPGDTSSTASHRELRQTFSRCVARCGPSAMQEILDFLMSKEDGIGKLKAVIDS